MGEIITLENQTNLQIKGATRVVSSTQTQSVIITHDRSLVVSGNELEVKKLDLENNLVEISGKISNLKFTNSKEKQPFLKRLFK